MPNTNPKRQRGNTSPTRKRGGKACSPRLRVGLVLLLGCLACAASAAESATSPPTREQVEFFEKQIRPVLAEHCWSCHGVKKQESGLRLDSRAAVLKGGDNGVVVKPGSPDESDLVAAIRRQGDLKMPPEDPLKPEAVAALARWVKEGLPWPDSPAVATASGGASAWKSHWAFQPVARPPVPELSDVGPALQSLDRFVLARLQAKGLSFSPPADRRTLLRRATFDLLGLPPTPDEVVQFENDGSPDAFERVVDRLLASPQYGERWARHWLDVARYADNKGYVFFEEKTYPWAYTYRDYVIRTMNEDLPYDRFVLEQLAADKLDLGGDQRPLAALGFLTLGAHFMNNPHDIIDDRIDVVTRGLLGLTVTCARCHDHKFDPLPQADYYSLYGVLRSSEEPIVPPLFTPPPDTEEYRKFAAELATLEQKLQDFVNKKYQELVGGARTRAGEYLLAANAQRNQPPTDDFMLLADPGDLNPTMTLRWQIYLDKSRRREHDGIFFPWHRFVALAEQEIATKSGRVGEQFAAQTRPGATVNPLVLAAFVNDTSRLTPAVRHEPPRSLAEVAKRYGELFNRVDKQWQEALSQATAANRPAPTRLEDAAAEELRQVLYGEDAPPNIPRQLGWGFLSLLPDRAAQGEFQKLIKEVETWSMTGPGAPPRAMVVFDAPTPYEPRIFLRGNPNRLGEAVPRQFLSVLSTDRRPFTSGSGRLEMARAIASPRNPLAARVLVNRVWLEHFGAGLVRTPSDFGLRSEPPSHPELLDHLASEFMADGWSLKRLHRRIMLSAAYRQGSTEAGSFGHAGQTVDPENRLLWKMNRRRLDFEATRDALLAVSGSLDHRLGGPAVQIFGGGLIPRRTIYGFIDRQDLPGLLSTFDFPSPSVSSPQRDSTTVSPQALFLMNNGFTTDVARRLAHRPEVASLPDADARVTQLYRLLFGRAPQAEEAAIAREFLGADPTPERLVQYAHGLLLTNEMVFVD